MIIALILIFFLYLLPAYHSYLFIQKAYSKNGRWSGQKPDSADVFFTFCPIANWILGTQHLTGDWKSDWYKRQSKSDYSDFFGVKK